MGECVKLADATQRVMGIGFSAREESARGCEQTTTIGLEEG